MPAGAGGATDSVAAAVANGAIAYMPVAWLVSLWLVAWGFDSSLQASTRKPQRNVIYKDAF